MPDPMQDPAAQNIDTTPQTQADAGQAQSSSAASAPGSSPSSATGGAPTSQGGQPAAGSPNPAQAAAQSAGWYAELEKHGIPLKAQTEQEAITQLANLYKQAQTLQYQYQQVAPYAQLYQQNQGKFHAWQQQQAEEERKRQQEQPKPWWNQYWQPPEFDPSWERLITKDEQGRLVPAEGAPPDIVHKYLNYRAYRTQQAERLMQNPFEFFEKPIKDLATQVAQEIVQKQLGGYQENAFAKDFIRENSSWLHERDPQGQVVVDPYTKQPLLSQWGQVFRNHVINAEKLGIRDAKSQQEYALGLTQRDWAFASQQQPQPQVQQPQVQQPAAEQRQAANQAFLQQAGQQKPAGRQTPPSNVPQQQVQKPLRQRMKEAFLQNGITMDQVLPL